MDLYYSVNATSADALRRSGGRLSSYGGRILDVEPILPTPIYRFVDIEGADSRLDFTEYKGEVKYKNDRAFVVTFDLPSTAEKTINADAVVTAFHGKAFNFCFGNSNKVYRGRFKISKCKVENMLYATYELRIDCIGYKALGGDM